VPQPTTLPRAPLVEVLSWNFPGRSEKSAKNLSLAGVSAESRADRVPNTNLERYRYLNPLVSAKIRTGHLPSKSHIEMR
jgi:hypothetical protein